MKQTIVVREIALKCEKCGHENHWTCLSAGSLDVVPAAVPGDTDRCDGCGAGLVYDPKRARVRDMPPLPQAPRRMSGRDFTRR